MDKEIVHFSHVHPLVLKKQEHNVIQCCSGCSKPISSGGLVFCCNKCNYVLHKSCTQLPPKMKHPLHPQHPLTLLSTPPYYNSAYQCNACRGIFYKSFVYHCSLCNYDLDIACASSSSYHSDEDLETQSEEDKTHVSDYEESYEDSSKTEEQDHRSPQQQDLGIGNFSHDHLLRFMEELSLQCADKLCDGCVQPITPPLFSCPENNCGFLLHKSCAELPRTKQHRFHPHPLTLFYKAPPYDGIYRCDGCKLLSNGFVYRCDECQFDLDVVCGSLMDKIQHQSHKHTLVLERTSIERECKGCSLRSKHVFVCDVCDDFAIDCGCATLPSKAWHMYDKHPLNLMYSAEGDLREYKCGICKEKRSPKNWFYYCDDCDFGGHPCCVLDKSKQVKFGGTFQYDVHSHPLALVEQVRKHPPCEACGEGCNGWTLECGQCKCYFHREGQCFWEQFKESAKYLALSGTTRRKYAASVLATTPNVTKK